MLSVKGWARRVAGAASTLTQLRARPARIPTNPTCVNVQAGGVSHWAGRVNIYEAFAREENDWVIREVRE